MNDEKAKMLKITTDQIEQKFGRGSIMKLGEGGEHLNIGVIPTGALPLDAALGIGGVPRGRIIEIYGPESSGKTTLATSMRCSFPSPTRASKRSKSAICSCAPVQSTPS